MRCAAPRRLNGNPPKIAAQERAQERYDYRDRPPLKDTRNWLRTAAVALGVLLVFAVGGGIYSFWPRSLDDVRSMAKQRNALFDVRAGRNQVRLCPSAAAGLLPDHSACGNNRGRQIADLSLRRAAQSLRVALQHRRRHECTALSGLYHVARKEELPGGKQSGQQPPVHPSSIWTRRIIAFTALTDRPGYLCLKVASGSSKTT